LPSSAPLVFICGLVVGGMRCRVSGRINLNSAELPPAQPYARRYDAVVRPVDSRRCLKRWARSASDIVSLRGGLELFEDL
jgi:hypothetical protein